MGRRVDRASAEEVPVEGFRAVLRSDELPRPDGRPEIRRVLLDGVPVLVARLEQGEVVAFGDVCPHQDTSLDRATFWDGNLRCPLHNYLYDPRTGENVLPARDARPENLWKLKPGFLRTHRVEERDGTVWVAERPEPPPTAYDAALERPPRRFGFGRPAGLAAGAPPPPAPGPAAGEDGPVEHPAEDVDVAVGQPFDLLLPTTFRPGYTWRVQVPAGLASVSERFQPGEQARHCVTLVAREPGPATVRCAYARPWEDTPAEVRTFVVRAAGVAEGG